MTQAHRRGHAASLPAASVGSSKRRQPAATATTGSLPSDKAGQIGGVRSGSMLPELHLADWRATKDTLHLYCQIVGKIRMASSAPRNHWWHVPLYVDVRGISTRRIHLGDTTFEVALDFVDHALVVATADGRSGGFALGGGLSVADFDRRLHGTLAVLGVDVEIKEEPFGVPMTTPFGADSEHASWDRDAVERYGRILDWSDAVLEEFSGWFCGKTSPVHLFWHSLDLAVSRSRIARLRSPKATA